MVTLSLAAGAAGVVSAVGLLFPSLWFFSVFGVALFAYVACRLSEVKNRVTFLIGTVFGFAYSGVALAWFWDVLPLDWAGVSPIKGFVFVGFSWFMVTIVFSVFFGLFTLLFNRVQQGKNNALFAASLWTILQYLQMYTFALLTTRDFSLSSLGAHFSPTMLGYSLAAFSPLLQFAWLGGIYLLTFVAVFIGFFFYGVMARYEVRVRIYIVLSAVSALTVVTFIDNQYPLIQGRHAGPSVQVALVTTNSPIELRTATEQEERVGTIQDAVVAWARDATTPDILVFPEASDVFAYIDGSLDTLRGAFDGPVSFIDSGTSGKSDARFVEMRFYDSGVRRAETYRKIFLVPQGEYTPWLFSQLLRLIGISETEQRTIRERSVAAGSKTTVVPLGGARVGALFCSDILSPALYRTLARDGANILINPASQSWFHGSARVDSLVLMLAKVRAVENNRFLAIAGNAVSSSIVSNRGEVLARSRESILSASIPLLETETPYMRFGAYVLLIPLCIVMIAWVRKRSHHNNEFPL